MFEQFDKWADKEGKKREAYDTMWSQYKQLIDTRQVKKSLHDALQLARQQVIRMVEVNRVNQAENEKLQKDNELLRVALHDANRQLIDTSIQAKTTKRFPYTKKENK